MLPDPIPTIQSLASYPMALDETSGSGGLIQNTLTIEYDLPASTTVTKGGFLECDAWRDITITCQAVTAIQKHENPIESILSSLERGEITATIGSSGGFLALTEGEAEVLGTKWVGSDHTKSYNYNHTAYTLTSGDGLRVYRSPEIDPRAIRAGHSKTGKAGDLRTVLACPGQVAGCPGGSVRSGATH